MTPTTRRSVLTGLALAPIAAPAALAQTPSEIMPLFRQWLTLWGKQTDAEIDKMFAIENTIADLPATTLEELAAKLIAATEYGEWGLDGPNGQKVLAEVCSLAGAPSADQPIVVVEQSPLSKPPADPIVGWFEEWQIQEETCDREANHDRGGEDFPVYETAYQERKRLGLLICNATATSIQGASAQFQWLDECFGYVFNDNLGNGFKDGFPNIGRSLKALVG